VANVPGKRYDILFVGNDKNLWVKQGGDSKEVAYPSDHKIKQIVITKNAKAAIAGVG